MERPYDPRLATAYDLDCARIWRNLQTILCTHFDEQGWAYMQKLHSIRAAEDDDRALDERYNQGIDDDHETVDFRKGF